MNEKKKSLTQWKIEQKKNVIHKTNVYTQRNTTQPAGNYCVQMPKRGQQ